MKQLLIVFLLAAAITACKKEAPTDMLNEMLADTTAVQQYSGDFENGPYGTVMGMANIFKLPDGSFQLQLKDFNTSNGPDLKVYLSKEIMPVNFIKLGDLKSTNGNQVYDIPGTIDFTEYKYACIHCEAFNHLFGTALLK